ncbi:MAG: hypothetical protein KC766_18890 [Myxococcales bacterium]|nr:hypothetical protein [Myxococcales bacterium]
MNGSPTAHRERPEPSRSPTSTRRLCWALALSGALAGCNSCNEDAPYTPFSVSSSGSSSATAASTSSTAPDATPSSEPMPEPPFKGKAALKAPARATKWKVAGLDLAAPDGQVFEQALEADFDGDEKADAVTWSVAQAPGKGAAATLTFHSSSGKNTTLTDLPGFVPTGPDCRLSTKLDQTGPKTLTLITRATCKAALIPRSPVGALTVLAPAADKPKLIELRLADVVPGERRQIQIDSTDHDKDGLDDVSLKLRLERGSVSATANFAWYQRAQGTARDDSEPRKSLDAQSYGALSSAKKTGHQALPQIQTLQRLWANVCAESATPRLFDGEGNPISCRAETVLARLNEAEAQAALHDEQPALALALLERNGWLGHFEPKTLAALEKAARAQLEIRSVKLKRLSVKALSRGPEPRISPLDFEDSGALLVQTTEGVQRVSASGEVSDASEEVDAWPLSLKSEKGVISRIMTPCDGAQLQLGLAQGEAVDTGIVSPRPGACSMKSSVPELNLVVLGSGDGGVEGFLAGMHIGPRKSRAEVVMRPHQAGTARSPDGKYEVLPLKAGIAVMNDQKPQLWTASGLEGTGLADCVVASKASAVACVESSGSVVFLTP